MPGAYTAEQLIESITHLQLDPMTASNAGTENQPPQMPLSPPASTRKPTTRRAIHAFFTPRNRSLRHRSPLREVSTTSLARNVSGTGALSMPAASVASTKNVHPLSPEDSPSNRASKKARRSLFPKVWDKKELGGEPLFESIPGAGVVKGKKLFSGGSGKQTEKVGSGGIFGRGTHQPEKEEEREMLKGRQVKIRPTVRNRVLMRMIGSGSMTGMRSAAPHHCASVCFNPPLPEFTTEIS